MHLLCIIKGIMHCGLHRIWTAGLQGSHPQGFCCLCGLLDAVIVVGPLLCIGLVMLVDQLRHRCPGFQGLRRATLQPPGVLLQTQHRSVTGLATSRLPRCSLQQVLKQVNLTTIWPEKQRTGCKVGKYLAYTTFQM